MASKMTPCTVATTNVTARECTKLLKSGHVVKRQMLPVFRRAPSLGGSYLNSLRSSVFGTFRVSEPPPPPISYVASSWGITTSFCPRDMRGQCYDGASNMSGARSGVKAVVQEAARLKHFISTVHKSKTVRTGPCMQWRHWKSMPNHRCPTTARPVMSHSPLLKVIVERYFSLFANCHNLYSTTTSCYSIRRDQSATVRYV